jgi:selenide, water dikinase
MLEEILQSQFTKPDHQGLVVGNQTKDDAAVYDLGGGKALIATTDFFMPIVDDPYDFGRIASANAISDIYAMGGQPILGLAILGWPVNRLPVSVARRVIEGSRSLCEEAGIPLAGGHSIDCPEPLFGMAVNGLADLTEIRKNSTAEKGNWLLLTKPLGTGILTTAEKKGILKPEHRGLAARQMMKLNIAGQALGKVKEVKAMTDVTGFGLLGHLLEMAEGSGLSARIHFSRIPLMTADLKDYIQQGAVPGGTQRNWESYKNEVGFSSSSDSSDEMAILADPQTSGGLLISVEKKAWSRIKDILNSSGVDIIPEPIGEMVARQKPAIEILD